MNFKIYIHLLLVNIISGSRSQHFLIETVDNNQAEHGSDYAEERKEEFTPKIHGNDDAEVKVEKNNDSQMTMEALSNWWDNLLNSNDTNINACGIGNLPTKCDCDDGKSHSPKEIYNDDANNMMKVMHAFDECKTGASQNCECPNGKKFIIPVFKDDLKKLFAAINETQTAVGGEEGTDYAEEPTEGVEPEKKKGIDGSGPEVEAVPEVNYESMVKGLATMIDSDDKNMNACGKGNLPTKCVCDDGVSFEPQGIFKKNANNWQPIMEAFALCKTGNAISCECANVGKFIMPNLDENVRKVIEAEKKARAAGGETGSDYADEVAGGGEPEGVTVSGPEVEEAPGPEETFNSMIKGLAAMVHSDDKKMNACGKGNLPTKCVCGDGLSIKPAGVFNKHGKNWQKVLEAFATCKTGTAVNCDCANGEKFIMPPLDENVRKLIEIGRKSWRPLRHAKLGPL